jgi:hypothetical protein
VNTALDETGATLGPLLVALVLLLGGSYRAGYALLLISTALALGWLVGSVSMGLLYDRSRVALVALAVLAQLASLPLFIAARRMQR